MNRAALALAVALSFGAAAPAQAATVGGEVAWPRAAPAPDPAFRDPRYPAQRTAALRLDAVDEAAVAALKRANGEPGRKALRIGLDRSLTTDSAPMAPLHWQPAPAGGVTARLSLHSPGAAALRVALRVGELPAGTEVRVAGTAGDRAMLDHASMRRMAAVDAKVWTPVTEGDTQLIELHVPAGSDHRWLRAELDTLSHLLVSPARPIDREKIGESEQPCMQDANCVVNPSSAFVAAKDAVAHMTFQTSEGGAVCTGTLLNDSDTTTQQPYLFSAAHCFADQATASSLATFFFYESTACGSGVEADSTVQVGGGAELLYADAASDVLLVRLNEPAPAGATFLGWDSTPVTPGSEFLVLHHPAGDAKKYSLGTITGLGGSTLASGEFIQVRYSNAPTEGGSSGSGLLTAGSNGFLLRGGLLGGSSVCTSVGTESPENSDDFSRFDLAFPSLQPFLQPTGTDPGQPPPVDNTDYSGAWSNPDQNGWGIVVVRGASNYGIYIYHYDQDSTPAWYLSAGALSGSTFNAAVLGFSGSWFGTVPYDPTALALAPAGNLTVTFTSPTTATISFTINGSTVETTINKLAF